MSLASGGAPPPDDSTPTVSTAIGDVSQEEFARAKEAVSGLPKRKPRKIGLDTFAAALNTDAANGEKFSDDHHLDFRYVADIGRWVRWDGKRWADALEGELLQAGKQTADTLLLRAVQLPQGEQKAAIAHALNSANVGRIRAMVAMASSEPSCAILSRDLDADPLLLNLDNGTLDLRTGLLLEHARDRFITRLVPIAFDPEALSPRWDQFLDEVFAKDEELIAFVARAVGYTLTGDTREHALFLLWGNGCNGKSVLVEILRALLGEFAAVASMSTFSAKRDNSTPTNDLAMLRGARLCSVQESEETAGFSESIVKSITGGDAISARFLHKEFFTYIPQFKPWIASNHKPRVRGTDDGFWRRVRLIPFVVSFLNSKDQTLLSKLRNELPGILNWAVTGCIEWQLKGLGKAAAVDGATQAYREESDSLAQFISDCVVIDSEADISAKRLYELYVKWCENNGERPKPQKRLGEYAFKIDGVKPYRTRSERGYTGIGERSDG